MGKFLRHLCFIVCVIIHSSCLFDILKKVSVMLIFTYAIEYNTLSFFGIHEDSINTCNGSKI